MVGQAVAELHLNRLAEAEAALQQAREKDSNNAEVLANAAVLAVISGKDPKEFLTSLESVQPQHALILDLQEKSELFDKAAAKFSAKGAA